ncbi:hypothetical protein AAP_06399 [Ascosphaera apis ARSEF 7405]|uniref:Uncharacterized protein n=1 Tax=Ascosphaera apis ARSEF 7405 TaxID=392613 RepID=A0A166MXW0_9EURO|nr:hypothetical protein AAP_06399 [Ascosphaera apis ARSEF 7405]
MPKQASGFTMSSRESNTGEAAPLVFPFHSLQSMDKTIEQEAAKMDAIGKAAGVNGRITFCNVPCVVIDLFIDDENRNRLLKSFDREKHLLQLKIPSAQHEIAGEIAADMVKSALARAGMADFMFCTGAPRAPQETGRTSWGRIPDKAFALTPECYLDYDNLDRWPQLVIEVGHSKSKQNLRMDVLHWFKIGGPCVRAAMLVCLSKDQISFEVWSSTGEEEIAPGGNMVAERVDGRFTATTDSTAQMIIPFQVLFMRKPKRGETDVRILLEDFLSLTFGLETIMRQREEGTKVDANQARRLPPFPPRACVEEFGRPMSWKEFEKEANELDRRKKSQRRQKKTSLSLSTSPISPPPPLRRSSRLNRKKK